MSQPVRIDPPIPVFVVDEKRGGNGLAHFMIDYGIETDLIWIVAMDSNGEVWCPPNWKIRFRWNWTVGRAKQ